jgi:hypothetical protein
MRKLAEVHFESFSSINFVTASAVGKMRQIYYPAVFTCTNCIPYASHVRHIFLRSGKYCHPCKNLHMRDCGFDSPCDVHWKMPMEIADRFSNWFFKTKDVNASTVLSFADDHKQYQMDGSPAVKLIKDIPMGLRLLNSIRSGSQKNQILHLRDISDRKGDAIISVKMKTSEPHWVSYRSDLIRSVCGIGPLTNSQGNPKGVVMPLQSLQQV